MFIKPTEQNLLLPAQWTNHAGNTHFSLQSKSKKQDSMFGSFWSTPKSKSAWITTISNYEYRILMKLDSKKQSFVVAVDDSFPKIRDNWNWIESNMYQKVSDIKAS